MHERHKRALKLSRNQVKHTAQVHAWALEKYQDIREDHLYKESIGMHPPFENLRKATDALLEITNDYLEALNNAIVVERLLEKA